MILRVEKYEKAIAEAKKFITRAEAAIVDYNNPNIYSSKANASAKRQSMELSNALVDVRKSDYK